MTGNAGHTMPRMSDSTFLHIESAAHGGAFGNNPTPEPTEAQCLAGNYKVGRVGLYGLALAIEQPRGSYRTGVDGKTGKRWASRMAAHYGYINGTKGNDGDCVDCFVGFYPQSQAAFVINQSIGGKFDEHKVMLAFPDEDTAHRAYLDSYERGWNGLESIVQASISQLKWWLKNGDMRRPLRADNLPHEGLETMTRKVQWNSDALPYDATLDQVLYEIRCSDASDGLLMDAVSAQEIIEDAEGVLTFDALVAPYAKLERRMELLRGVMERAGGDVKPIAMQITDPFKQRGVANVAAIFELSDGQTVSIYFHNPDVTPNKMAPTDEVISWKWLLNKKDITIVVAPERGADLNVREVARRIMRLAEKNSAAFQRMNAKRAERMQSIQALKDEISGLEGELAAAERELEVAKVSAEGMPAATGAPGDALYAELRQILVARGWEDKDATEERVSKSEYFIFSRNSMLNRVYVNKWGSSSGYVPIGDIDPAGKDAKELADAIERAVLADEGKAADIDPTTPDGYAKVVADESLQLKYQDVLDAFFQGRIVAVRNALRALGWEGRSPTDTRLYKGDSEVQPTFKHVGAGRNVVGFDMNEIKDDLTKTPEQFAAEVDSAALAESARRAQVSASPADEQALLDAYVRSFGDAATVLNAAVSAVDMEAIKDSASAAAEISKLRDASKQAQYGIIGKASNDLESAGLNTWDERLSGLRDTAGFGAWNLALDAYQKVVKEIEAAAKDKLIASGKAELEALPADAPLNDVARAIFHKHGIDIGQRGDNWVARVVQNIEDKNADGLRDILAGVGSDSNKASMEIFERATGIKLAKTQRERGQQIDEWAGITPEKRTEIEAAKDAAWLERERDRRVKDAWDMLKRMNVRNTGSGTVTDGQQYLLGQVAGGYGEVGTYKRGAATVYGLKKGSDLVFVNNRNFNGFLKAALAVGGLRKALASVGAGDAFAEDGRSDKIAAVDAAYTFASATDDFKLWLAGFLDKTDYSPFLAARAMDEAARRDGGAIEWGMFSGAALDDVGQAVAVLEQSLAVVEGNEPINRAEGDIAQAQLEAETAASIREAITALTEADYVPSEEEIGGTFDADSITMDSAAGAYADADKQAISATKALLQYFRDFLASDAKFAKVPTSAYGWTAEGQVMDKEDAKNRLRKLIDVAINRKAGIPDLTPKEDQRLADYAHDARIISDYLTRRIRHTGSRNLLRTPEMKAKYPHIDNQPSLDSATLDASGGGYVGKVKKDADVVGRIDIGGDGKAMVFVGQTGDERPKMPDGSKPAYTEDAESLAGMIDALLAPAASDAGAAKATKEDVDKALSVLRPFMSASQMGAVKEGMRGEEAQFFFDKAVELAGIVSTMPQTYDQDGKGDAAVAYLHYFRGAGDWYITEKDMAGTGTEQAFGWADLGSGGELGYISIAELVGAGVELDFHFEPKTIGKIKGVPDSAGEEPQHEQSSRSGTAEEQAAADAALVMASDVVVKLGGTFTADGYSGKGTIGAWSYGNATVNGETIRLAASGGGVVQVNGKPHGPDGELNLSADQVSAAILAVAPAKAGKTAADAWVLPLVEPSTLISLAKDRGIAANVFEDAPYAAGTAAIRAELERNGVKMDIVWNAAEKQYGLHRLEGGKEVATAIKMAPLSELLDEFNASAATALPPGNSTKDADRALFQSVIDGTVADILAPDLADSLEAAYNRNQDDPELVGLFEQAVAAYQSAMMSATANLGA